MNTKELAAQLGISEQALRQYFSKHHFRKKGGKWAPTEKQIDEVIEYYFSGSTKEERKNNASNERESASYESSQDSIVDALNKELALLQEQLSVKDKEIERLHTHIDDLTSSLKALSANAALNSATDAKEKLLADVEQESQETKQKHWWQFWL